jgi:hypothetical protein
MIPKDSDSSSDGDWDDPEELGWTEFEWEKYLRSQDEVVQRYISLYEQSGQAEDRIDFVARQMDWDDLSAEDDGDEDDQEDLDDLDDFDPYTLQRNPVFIAATALYQLITRNWELSIIGNPGVPAALAVSFQTSLFRGERNALLGIQSLDLGDYTLGVSLFKRAMRDLNVSMGYLNAPQFAEGGVLASFRTTAMPQLFDLREVLLRVVRECRDEIARHPRPTDEDEGDKRAGEA